MNARSRLAGAIALATLSAAAQAQDCLDRYKVEGSFLSGRTHRTESLLRGTSAAEAFPRVLAYLGQIGFTVMSSNAQAGTIESAQSNMLANGKRMPFNLSLREESDGTRLLMSISSGMGAAYREADVKNTFCKTAAAAADGGAATPKPAAESALAAPAAPAPRPRPRPNGVAAIADTQQAAIQAALNKGPHPTPLKSALPELLPTLAAFIERFGCISHYSALGSLDEFAAPGKTFKHSVQRVAMRDTPYHDKNQCLTVLRVHGWTMPADNALRFEVAFKAEDSGEAAKSEHEVVRQPDGSWLFTR